MRTNPRGRPPQRWWWILGVLGTVVLIVVASVVVIRPGPDKPAPDDSETSTALIDVSHEPLIARESTSLTVPNTIRLPGRSFYTEAGRMYLVEFEATAEKPIDSPGSAMYFGASLACSGPDGSTIRSVGGTQNVRSGERVTIRNQFLLEADHGGEHACRVSLNSPNEEAAAEGTSAAVVSTWTVTPARPAAFEAPAEKRLPQLVEQGHRAIVFQVKHENDQVLRAPADLMSTVHVTTCTIVNGSAEDGRTWCPEEDVDPEGSSVVLTYRLDVLDSGGGVCDSQNLDAVGVQIDRLAHHQVLHSEAPIADQASACGPRLRFVVELENDGPAPLVIHRNNSTFILNIDR